MSRSDEWLEEGKSRLEKPSVADSLQGQHRSDGRISLSTQVHRSSKPAHRSKQFHVSQRISNQVVHKASIIRSNVSKLLLIRQVRNWTNLNSQSLDKSHNRYRRRRHHSKRVAGFLRTDREAANQHKLGQVAKLVSVAI
jgi:hypothetical protein